MKQSLTLRWTSVLLILILIVEDRQLFVAHTLSLCSHVFDSE